MTELLNRYGSFRRLCEAYWRGELDVEHERQIEDAIPKPTLAHFKPIDACNHPNAQTVTIHPNGHNL